MPLTTAHLKSKFARFRDHVFTGAKVTLTYRGESYPGIRSTLETSQVTETYGLLNEYQFSVLVGADDITERARENEAVTVVGTDLGDEPQQMRVLGKGVGPCGATIRLDIKGYNA